MALNPPAYLTSKDVIENQWVKSVKAAEDPRKLADLIIARILKPADNGPNIFIETIESGLDNLEVDIISDLVSFAEIEWDIFNSAVSIIMSRIDNGEIRPNLLFLENIFFLINNYAVELAAKPLLNWLSSHKSMLSDQSERRIYSLALEAYVYAQEGGDDDALAFWKTIWLGSDRSLWGISFKGLRFCSIKDFLPEMPIAYQRNCDDVNFTVASLWRVEGNEGIGVIDAWLSSVIKNKENWAFEIINNSTSTVKFSDKQKLIDRIASLQNKIYVQGSPN